MQRVEEWNYTRFMGMYLLLRRRPEIEIVDMLLGGNEKRLCQRAATSKGRYRGSVQGDLTHLGMSVCQASIPRSTGAWRWGCLIFCRTTRRNGIWKASKEAMPADTDLDEADTWGWVSLVVKTQFDVGAAWFSVTSQEGKDDARACMSACFLDEISAFKHYSIRYWPFVPKVLIMQFFDSNVYT